MFSSNNQSPIPRGVDRVRPVKMLIARSGTYQPQHRRPWEVQATGHTLNRIVGAIERLNSTSVNSGLVSSLGGMLSLSTQSQGEIVIPNQWDSVRGIFMLLLDFEMRDGNTIRYIIQGYTETPEFTENHLAPDMVFHVNNSISCTQKTRIVSGVAQGTGLVMQANYHPLQSFDHLGAGMGSSWGMGSGSEVNAKQLIRPQDIVSNMANASLKIEGAVEVEDYSMQLGGAGNAVQSSTRSNAVGSTMAARLLNAFNSAHGNVRGQFDVSPGDIADNAFNELVEQDSANDLFLAMLTQHKRGTATASFTARQLMDMVPGITDSSIFKAVVNPGGRYSMAQKQDSMGFGKQTLSAVAAANLQSALPGIMVESLLHTVSFTAVSNGPSRDVTFGSVVATGFDPETSVRQWGVFAHRFKTELIPLIKGSNNYPLDMHVNCSFNGEFRLQITVAEEDPLTLISPAFCDGLFSPVITTDEASALSLSNEMMTACEAVSDQLLINQERATRATISTIDRMTPDVSQFRQGDVLSMPGFPQRTAPLDATPSMQVKPAATSSGQMSVQGGSIAGNFK